LPQKRRRGKWGAQKGALQFSCQSRSAPCAEVPKLSAKMKYKNEKARALAKYQVLAEVLPALSTRIV